MLIDLKKYNLQRKIKDGTLSHAIILSGKMNLDEISKEISKSYVCSDRIGFCNTCKFCLKTEKNINPDIIIVDFLDKNISVDEIRKIRKDCYILPNECKKKVYIIKNGQNLGQASQNALLKILEDPPKYVCFIIQCDDEQKLMHTILSRCSIYRFNAESYIFDAEIMNNATKIIKSIACNDELSLMEVKIKSKPDLMLVISAVKVFLRDTLIINEENCIDFDICKKLFSSKNAGEIFKIYNICIKIEELCEYNVSAQNMIYYFATELYKN